MNLTAVVIEDNHEMAEFLRDVLLDEGHTVFVENAGITGLRRIEQIQPELVLLDVVLPDIDGRAVCERIKKNMPDTTVIMITGQDTPTDIARGLNIGADDYIAKPVDPKVLLARINARFRAGQKPTIVFKDLSLNTDTHEVKRGNKLIELSPQEFKLLEYLMHNSKRVLSREVILSRLWQTNPDVQTRVVDVYIGYLRKKIDFKSPRLIHSVRGFGYVLKEKIEP